jgi:uncharacterized protein (TIGR02271 family)
MAQTQTGTGALVGYFDNSEDARQAVEALHEAGFSSAHLGMAHRAGSTTSDSTTRSGSSTASRVGHKIEHKAESTWDKIVNMFSGGNRAEPYADERTQGDLATREVTENPADENRYNQSTAANRVNRNDVAYNRGDDNRDYDQYDTSDLHNSLAGLHIPEERARYFNHRLQTSQSGAIVTVNAGDRANEARSILLRFGADLGDNASNYDYSQTTRDYSQTARDDSPEFAQRQEQRNNIQLLGEVLRVHKERIDRGEVRVRKEVVVENQTIQVPVTREELVVERHAAGQNTPASGNIGEDEIRIPLSEERASVDKETVVREEVNVGKKPVQDVRDLSGEVRHEELVVDDQTKRSA